MPTPREGESKEDYVSRCIAYCVKEEGMDQKAAAGKCYGMWKQHMKQDADERYLFMFSCENIEPLNNPVELAEKQPTNHDIKNDFKATCVYGDRFYKGKFLPMKELQKAYTSLNGSYHDINHWGTTYLDGDPNIEYIVGYQDNAKLDTVTKALTADIHVSETAEKYKLWRGFVDINQKMNRTPNVSVSFYASKKEMKAKDLGIDFAAQGYNGDDDVEYLYDLEFQALSTVFKGACSDKDGCGIGIQKHCHQPPKQENMKSINQIILEEKINRLKRK